MVIAQQMMYGTLHQLSAVAILTHSQHILVEMHLRFPYQGA